MRKNIHCHCGLDPQSPDKHLLFHEIPHQARDDREYFCMGSRVKRGMTLLFIIFLSLCSFNHSYSQEIVSPLNIPLFLSGNFGELRSDHFHSGLDLKTQGVTGHAVKAVKAGFISRISVSPSGFGRAVYIDHPDGTTSVYGHLDRFVSKIESVVRDSQYIKESFSVNLVFSEFTLPIKQGEVFAYSGNTGGSGGPHLHFELRDTKTEKPVDPLPAFRNHINDTRPPEIRGLMFFPQLGRGVVNESADKQTVNIIKDQTGKFVLEKPVKAWGLIGIGVKAYDRMDATTNIYGVKEIRLTVDNVEIFRSVIDIFSFDESRYLNSFIDWEEWKTNQSFFMKSFIDPGNKLSIFRSYSNGLISIQETRNYKFEYSLKDSYGNTTTFAFNVAGERQQVPEEKKEGVFFPFDRNNEYSNKGISLSVPYGSLYNDFYLNVEAIPSGLSLFAPLYTFKNRTVLHNACLLTLTITNDLYHDKSKYGVVSVSKNKFSWLGGEYEAKKMKVRIRELGQFTVAVDTVPPVVIPVNRAKWTINQCITFKISDNLSGISFYQGRLNSQFVLFEYDPKTNSLFCKYDAKRMKKGKQILTLLVRDGAKNETVEYYDVVF